MVEINLSAADAFVIVMLSMLALSLGIVALLIVCIRKNASQRDRRVEALLDEVADRIKRKAVAPPRPPPKERPKSAEPWERPADWWKG